MMCNKDFIYVAFFTGAKAAFWMLADFSVLDMENELWTWQNYDTYNKEEISIFFCESYSRQMFTIARKLQSFHLTDGEVNILRALVLFNPGKLSKLWIKVISLCLSDILGSRGWSPPLAISVPFCIKIKDGYCQKDFATVLQSSLIFTSKCR